MPRYKLAAKRLVLSWEAPGLLAYVDACRAGRFSARAELRLRADVASFCSDVLAAWPQGGPEA
jgi:hypothetical protein